MMFNEYMHHTTNTTYNATTYINGDRTTVAFDAITDAISYFRREFFRPSVNGGMLNEMKADGTGKALAHWSCDGELDGPFASTVTADEL